MQLQDGGEFGPAMRRLLPRQRAFVQAYMALGASGRGMGHRAAAIAGYDGDEESLRVRGSVLLSDQRVQDALLEEGRKALNSHGPIAADVVHEIMVDPTVAKKDRLRAAEMVLNRSGLHGTTEHKVQVEHQVDEGLMLRKVEMLCAQLGLDPRKLLGPVLAAKAQQIEHDRQAVVDAEFVEVELDEETEALLR